MRHKFGRRRSGLAERIEEATRHGRARCPRAEHVVEYDDTGSEIPVMIFVRRGDQMVCSPCAAEMDRLVRA